MRNPVFVFVLLCCSLVAPLSAGPQRTWTSSDGRTLEAELVDYDGTQVKLLIRGTPSLFAKTLLSKEDVAFLDTWLRVSLRRQRRSRRVVCGRNAAPPVSLKTTWRLAKWDIRG